MEKDRDIQYFIASGSVRSISMGFQIIIFPIYLSLIGANPVTIGLLIGITQLSGVTRSFIFGMLADKYGKKPFLILEPLFGTAQFLSLLVSGGDITIIAIGAMIGGTAGAESAAGGPVGTAYLADRSTNEKRTFNFSRFWFATTLAGAVGSAIGALPRLFQDRLGFSVIESYDPLFALGVMLLLLASISLIPIKDSRAKQIKEKKSFWPTKSKDIVLKMSISEGLNGFAVRVVIPFLPLWFFSQFGADIVLVSSLFALGRITLALSQRILAPRIAERIGSVKSVILVRVLSAIFLVLMPFMPSFHWAGLLWLLSFSIGLAAMPIRRSYLMGIVEQDERGASAAITQSTWMITGTIAPTIGGYLMVALSSAVPFYTSFIFFLANAGTMYKFFNNIKPPEEIEKDSEQ